MSPIDRGAVEPVSTAAGTDEVPSVSLSTAPLCGRWIPVSVWQIPPSPPASLNRIGLTRFEFDPCGREEGHVGGCKTEWDIRWDTEFKHLHRSVQT